MAFTFPTDSNSKAGAVKATPDGNDFYVPTNPTLYNGSTFDKFVNNQEGVLLPSSARATGATSPNQINYNAKGIILWVNMTSVGGGTAGVQPYLQAIEPVSGTAVNINGSGIGTVTGTGIFYFFFYPGISGAGTGSANSNLKSTTNFILPRTWRVNTFHNDAFTYTYSVGYTLIL